MMFKMMFRTLAGASLVMWTPQITLYQDPLVWTPRRARRPAHPSSAIFPWLSIGKFWFFDWKCTNLPSGWSSRTRRPLVAICVLKWIIFLHMNDEFCIQKTRPKSHCVKNDDSNANVQRWRGRARWLWNTKKGGFRWETCTRNPGTTWFPGMFCSCTTRFIILNIKCIIFDTKCIIFNTSCIIFNTKCIIFNASLLPGVLQAHAIEPHQLPGLAFSVIIYFKWWISLFKMMKSAFKMTDSVVKIMNSVLKMTDFVF